MGVLFICNTSYFKSAAYLLQTLPKAKRTRGLSSAYQSNFLGHITSFHTNLDQISSSESRPSINFKISTKHQHIDYHLNFKILTNPTSFRVSTKLHNLNQASAVKYCPNISFTISPELHLQNLEQTLCSKSEQKFNLMTKLQLPHLHQTFVNKFLNTNISNLNKFELVYSHARVTSMKSSKQQSVSESVSEFSDNAHSDTAQLQ